MFVDPYQTKITPYLFLYSFLINFKNILLTKIILMTLQKNISKYVNL